MEKEKPPILGLVQGGGLICMHMLKNVQQKVIQPVIDRPVEKGTLINTDECDIHAKLKDRGHEHQTVCHSIGEYARDENGDGKHEVHVNTTEGPWSLLRPWLYPHRGIAQGKLPHYLSFFQFNHNTRKRGKSLLPQLVTCLTA